MKKGQLLIQTTIFAKPKHQTINAFRNYFAPVPGHLYPCCLLSTGLKKAGHRVTVYNIADSEDFVRKIGFDFYRIGEKEFPKGSWKTRWKPARSGSNIWRDTRILKAHIEIAEIMLRDLPQILEKENVDVLIVDHLQPQGSSLAEKLKIPFITICSILPLHKDLSGAVPATFAWWQPKNSFFNRNMNKLSHHLVDILSYSFIRKVNCYRTKWHLKPIKSLENSFSKIAQIGVIPPEIDFQRPLIPNYYAVGPSINERTEIDFPWHKLDGRPIVYASMGTIRNKISKFYTCIIKVFEKRPDLQLILSKGAWNGDGIELGHIPENIIVVDFAPQIQILKKAKLCISHAGPGTIIESIFFGVPILAIPVADDQPAMAARVVFHKLGISIPYRKLNTNNLYESIIQVLNSDEIQNSVNSMSLKFQKYKGADTASEIILSKLGVLNLSPL